jgi:Tfp pilus assembly protein PilV
MKQALYTKGYSLVEVLVAISILMLSIVGPITIAAKSLQSAQYARQQNTAFFLAQEGITAANALRNDNALQSFLDSTADAWEWVSQPELAPCFETAGCNIDFRDDTLFDNVVSCSTASNCTLQFSTTTNRAAFQHQSGDPSPYTRVITFEFANPEEVIVRSTVSWTSIILGGSQEVELTTSLFNLYKE